jgi:hypothetical protein
MRSLGQRCDLKVRLPVLRKLSQCVGPWAWSKRKATTNGAVQMAATPEGVPNDVALDADIGWSGRIYLD